MGVLAHIWNTPTHLLYRRSGVFLVALAMIADWGFGIDPTAKDFALIACFFAASAAYRP